MNIFIDANVLFTAAYSPRGKAALLIESLNSLMITSDYAAEEARRNILAKRPEAISTLEGFLAKIDLVPSVKIGACPIKLPEKNIPIFLSALKSKATHLLTGDLKDFGPHMNQPKKSAGVLIQTVAAFLAAL